MRELPSVPLEPTAPDDEACVDGEMCPDIALCGRVRDGDHAAMGELWERHNDTALKYSAWYGQEAAGRLAEDIAAESWLAVYAALTAGKGPRTNFGGYLRVAVRHSAVRHRRHHARVAPHDALPEQFDPAPGPAERAEQAYEREAVLAALATLPAEQQELLWALMVDEVPTAELSREHGIGRNALAARCYRAREAIRIAYDREHSRHTRRRIGAPRRPTD